MVFLLFLLFLFGSETAPVTPEIRGVVVEPDTNLPVEAAEIRFSVQQPGPIRLNGGWKQDESVKIVSDNTGAFRIPLEKPGAYRVEAVKSGFVDSSASAEVKLTSEKPTAAVKLFLARPGRLIGTVVDEETRKPIPNLTVKAVGRMLNRFFVGRGAPARTDAEGRFAAENLIPGDYLAEIGPQITGEKRVLTTFTEKDTKLVDRDYEHTYWPGGHGAATALPLPIRSGGALDVGQLSARRVPYYRVHVRIPDPPCRPGETLRLTEQPLIGDVLGYHPLGDVPCSPDLLITGYEAGNYRLLLSIADREPADRRTATLAFSILDQNIAMDAALMPGLTVQGAFRLAEGAKPPDYSRLMTVLSPVDRTGTSAEAEPFGPDSEGRFRFENVRPTDHNLLLGSLPPTHYVKEILFNGIPQSADLIPLGTAAMAHMITVVLDDKPATITGSVTSNGQPASRPFIMAVKWPPIQGSTTRYGSSGTYGDENGRFRIAGLAPGEYRVAAILSPRSGILPEAWMALLAKSAKIEIGPNAIQNIALEGRDLN